MDRENSEDVTSEFFIKLWTLADRYQPGNGHKGWMATIARNMAIDYIRAHKREILVDPVPDLVGDEAGSSTANSAQAYTMQQTAAPDRVEDEVLGQITIEEVLKQLNPAEVQIINMKILGDMTFKEIAATLGIPMGTVTWRYQNAMNKLRRCGYESQL